MYTVRAGARCWPPASTREDDHGFSWMGPGRLYTVMDAGVSLRESSRGWWRDETRHHVTQTSNQGRVRPAWRPAAAVAGHGVRVGVRAHRVHLGPGWQQGAVLGAQWGRRDEHHQHGAGRVLARRVAGRAVGRIPGGRGRRRRAGDDAGGRDGAPAPHARARGGDRCPGGTRTAAGSPTCRRWTA